MSNSKLEKLIAAYQECAKGFHNMESAIQEFLKDYPSDCSIKTSIPSTNLPFANVNVNCTTTKPKIGDAVYIEDTKELKR